MVEAEIDTVNASAAATDVAADPNDNAVENEEEKKKIVPEVEERED